MKTDLKSHREPLLSAVLRLPVGSLAEEDLAIELAQDLATSLGDELVPPEVLAQQRKDIAAAIRARVPLIRIEHVDEQSGAVVFRLDVRIDYRLTETAIN